MSKAWKALGVRRSALGHRVPNPDAQRPTPKAQRPTPCAYPALRILAAAALLSLLPSPGRADIITRKQEVTLGREAASQVEGMLPVDTDPVALARVRRIGRRLVAASDDKHLPFEFHVIDAGEVNAFALPGGFVYVYRGLLQLLPNDDSLGFVLGHEMTHALRRHGTRQAGKNLAIQAALTAALGGNAIAAQQLGYALVSAKFSRDDEEEADRRGIELMANAGYNPDSAAETMLVLRRASEGDDTPALLRSHPAPNSRLKMLRNLAAEWKSRQPAPEPEAAPTAVALAELQAPLMTSNETPPFAVAPCPYWPMRVGSRWYYRVSTGDTSSSVTVTAVEQIGGYGGLYRIERDLGRGVRQSTLVATASDRVAARPLAGADWRRVASFGDPEGAESGRARLAGLESVRVPAGSFEALRVEELDGYGEVIAVTWYTEGIGPVRKHWMATGVTEELERFWVPGVTADPGRPGDLLPAPKQPAPPIAGAPAVPGRAR